MCIYLYVQSELGYTSCAQVIIDIRHTKRRLKLIMKKIILKTVIAAVVSLISCIPISSVFAEGVGVTPRVADIEGEVGDMVVSVVSIVNDTNHARSFTIRPDVDSEIIIIDQEVFDLEAGESRSVSMTVTPTRRLVMDGTIKVISRPVTALPDTLDTTETEFQVRVRIESQSLAAMAGLYGLKGQSYMLPLVVLLLIANVGLYIYGRFKVSEVGVTY